MPIRTLFVPSLVLALAGCAAIFGFDELSDQSSGQPDSSVGTDGGEPDAGDPDGGPPDPAIADFYVSPQGDDAADGTVQRPLRSVRAAVDRATAALAGGRGQRIAVCVGDYPERLLSIRGKIELHGNYDCEAWTRRPFDDTKLGPSYAVGTRLTDLEPGNSLLELSDDASGSPEVDGLDITVSQSVAGIGMDGAAKVREIVIVNRSPPSFDAALVPQGISTAARNSVIEHCAITVQPAAGPAGAGAIGIGVSGGPHTIRRNDVAIFGAIGQGAGLLAGGGGDGAIEVRENRFTLANGMTTGENATTSIGIQAFNAVLNSTRNAVQLETPGNSVAFAQVIGLVAAAPSQMVSDGDVVIGPTVLRTDSHEPLLRFAGMLGDGALKKVVNASILLATAPTLAVEESAGIRLSATSAAYLAHNTMYFSSVGKPVDGGGPTVPPVRALVVGDGALTSATAIQFDANLVLFGASTQGLVRGSCNVITFDSLARNRYAGSALPATGVGCAPTGEPLEALWPGAADAGADNVAFTCDGPCLDVLDSTTTRVRDEGLRLTAAGCRDDLKVAVVPEVPRDRNGVERTGSTTYAGALTTCP